eukprot:3507279-Pyramimonas_sp.AAC.1
MLESYDARVNDQADQALPPRNVLGHARARHPISLCEFLRRRAAMRRLSLPRWRHGRNQQDRRQGRGRQPNQRPQQQAASTVPRSSSDWANDMQRGQRKVRKVYCGLSGLTADLSRRDFQTRTLELNSGWYFSGIDTQKKVTWMLEQEEPDDLRVSPECGL